MGQSERVTITLPSEVLLDIDRLDDNRSRFVVQAVKHELRRRQREELRRSLQHPHPETEEIARYGLAEWAQHVPDDSEQLLDMASGTAVKWVPESGWVETTE